MRRPDWYQRPILTKGQWIKEAINDQRTALKVINTPINVITNLNNGEKNILYRDPTGLKGPEEIVIINGKIGSTKEDRERNTNEILEGMSKNKNLTSKLNIKKP